MNRDAFLLALDLEDKPVLLVGGSEEARLRLENLVHAGALVTLVGPEFCPELEAALATSPPARVERREPLPTDLDGHWLVTIADRNPAWVDLFGPLAFERRIPLCAVDQPKHNTFAHVGIARAGKLQLGISTSGAVPGIAGVLKRSLQALLDRSDFASIVADLEEKRRNAEPSERSRLLRSLASRIRLEGRLYVDDDDR